jgi:hypothetical protein
MKDLIEYRGFVIKVDCEYRFAIQNEPFNRNQTYASLTDAKAKIDHHLMAAAKQARRKVQIPVLDRDGRRTEIRGVNVGTGYVLANGEPSAFFPDVPWIKTRLQQRLSLTERLRELNNLLQRFTIDGRRQFGRVHPDVYDNIIINLEQDIAGKTKDAQKIEEQVTEKEDTIK